MADLYNNDTGHATPNLRPEERSGSSGELRQYSYRPDLLCSSPSFQRADRKFMFDKVLSCDICCKSSDGLSLYPVGKYVGWSREVFFCKYWSQPGLSIWRQSYPRYMTRYQPCFPKCWRGTWTANWHPCVPSKLWSCPVILSSELDTSNLSLPLSLKCSSLTK